MKNRAMKPSFFAAGALFFCSFSAAEPIRVRWVLTHEPSKAVEEAAKDFAAKLEKETAGGMRVELLTRSEYWAKYKPGQPLGRNGVMQDVIAGNVEMCQAFSSSLGHYVPGLWALNMPYLFKDYEQAEKVLEGPIGRGLLAKLAPNSGLKALGISYSGGLMVFATKKPVHRPEDMKGMKLRGENYRLQSEAQVLRPEEGEGRGAWNPVATSIARQLGAEPVTNVPLPRADGVEITTARLEERGEFRHVRYITDTRHTLLTTIVVVNDKFFNSLPENYQRTFERLAFEAARKERQASIAANHESRKKLEGLGIRFIELSNDERSSFENALQPVYQKLGSTVGQKLIDAIRQTPAGPTTAQR